MIVAPNDTSEAKSKAVKQVESSVVDAFRDLLGSVSDDILEQYEKQTDAAAIADMVSLDSLDDLASDLLGPLEDVYADAGDASLSALEISETGLFDLVHEDAKEYASRRAAELIGKKFINGTLVDNPDANFAITEATRSGLKDLIERAYSDGLSPKQLGKEIKDAYAFSPSRADLIARTETSKASIEGSLAGWKRSGVVEGKSSLLSDDHDQDDECNDNEDDGVIPLDAQFSSGDDGPPYHPGCNCALVAELSDEGDDI